MRLANRPKALHYRSLRSGMQLNPVEIAREGSAGDGNRGHAGEELLDPANYAGEIVQAGRLYRLGVGVQVVSGLDVDRILGSCDDEDRNSAQTRIGFDLGSADVGTGVSARCRHRATGSI